MPEMTDKNDNMYWTVTTSETQKSLLLQQKQQKILNFCLRSPGSLEAPPLSYLAFTLFSLLLM